MKYLGRIITVTLFTVYIATVVYLCFGHIQTPEELPKMLWGIPLDKCAHFLMFLPFPFLSTAAFGTRNNWWKTLFWSVISGICIAFCLELLQSLLTSYRQTDPWDLVSNIAAITTGSLLTVAVKRPLLVFLHQ